MSFQKGGNPREHLFGLVGMDGVGDARQIRARAVRDRRGDLLRFRLGQHPAARRIGAEQQRGAGDPGERAKPVEFRQPTALHERGQDAGIHLQQATGAEAERGRIPQFAKPHDDAIAGALHLHVSQLPRQRLDVARGRKQLKGVGKLKVKARLADPRAQGGAGRILQHERADAIGAPGGNDGRDHGAKGVAEDDGGVRQMRVHERHRIGGEVGDGVVRGRTTGTSVAAMVQRVDVPAFGQRGQQRFPIAPAAGHSVKEHQGRTVLGSDGAVQRPFTGGQQVFLHSLHGRSIPILTRQNNRLDGRGSLVMLHAVFTTQHRQTEFAVKRGVPQFLLAMLRLTENGAPLVRQTLVDSVYETLLEAILCGKMASGTDLNEVSLARELGVSRTPVHEALAWLAADELVEVTGSRARVRTMSAQEVADLYDVRQLLECTAVERAAKRISDAVLHQLRAEIQELARTKDEADWPARAIDFDIRFHDAVAEASGNARLRAEIQRYRLLVRAFCRITGGRVKNLQNSFQEHLVILRALEQRDAKAARRAMGAHIERRVKVVLAEVYPEKADADGASPGVRTSISPGGTPGRSR